MHSFEPLCRRRRGWMAPVKWPCIRQGQQRRTSAASKLSSKRGQVRERERESMMNNKAQVLKTSIPYSDLIQKMCQVLSFENFCQCPVCRNCPKHGIKLLQSMPRACYSAQREPKRVSLSRDKPVLPSMPRAGWRAQKGGEREREREEEKRICQERGE